MLPRPSFIGREPIRMVPGCNVVVDKDKYGDRGLHVVRVEGRLGNATKLIREQVGLNFRDDGMHIDLEQDIMGVNYEKALLGTYRTEIQNMIFDTHVGVASFLQLVGIGYRAYFEKNRPNILFLRVGFTHAVEFPIRPDVLIEVSDPGTEISIFGCDRRVVNEVARQIRRIRMPEAYKGKGIRYLKQKIKLKQRIR